MLLGRGISEHMSTEIILKALIALLPVIVLIIVLYRLDSHRLTTFFRVHGTATKRISRPVLRDSVA